MKKFIFLIFILMFTLVFIGCNEGKLPVDDPSDNDNPIIENNPNEDDSKENNSKEDVYYKVTFIIDEEVINEVSVKENSKVDKPQDPEKENNQFIGWYLDDLLFDFETLIIKDIKLTAEFIDLTPRLEISVDDDELNIGYSIQINAKFYNTEEETVKYEVDKEGIVLISSKGLVTAIRPGVVKITVYSETFGSNVIEIEVLEEVLDDNKIDLKGYTIKHNFSQFDKEYLLNSNSEEDKELYQSILEIEEKYNCSFVNNESESKENLDFYYSSRKISNCHEISALYEKYQSKYPAIFTDDRYSYIYDANGIYSIGSWRKFGQNQGFYYDLEIIKELGLDDPLSLYLEGKWTYSNFIAWCEEAKAILDKNPIIDRFGITTSVISCGSEYELYMGMMNTIGKRVVDLVNKEINLDCEESYKIIEIINQLINQQIYNPSDPHESLLVVDFSYINAYFKFGSYADMYSGYYKIYNPSFVPFPYPDTYILDDVYYKASYGNDIYFSASELIKYPVDIEFEDVFEVIIELLINLQLIENAEKPFYNGSVDGMDERIIEYMDKIPYDRYIYDPTNSNRFNSIHLVINDFIDNRKIDNWMDKFNNDLKNYNMEYSGQE